MKMWEDKEVLVIGAHFDDHILGCGGVLYFHSKWHILTIDEMFVPSKFDQYSYCEIADFIELNIKKVDIVFTHWPYDWNTDHQKVAQATLIACRRKEIDIYFYEVLSSTEQALSAFKPNTYFQLPEVTMEGKCHMFDKLTHPSAQNSVRNSKNILIQAKYRGLECGHKYAEAFILFRQVL